MTLLYDTIQTFNTRLANFTQFLQEFELTLLKLSQLPLQGGCLVHTVPGPTR